jgi:peroxiredoxin
MTMTSVGQACPRFALPAVDGRTVDIADYRGRRVALSCGPPGDGAKQLPVWQQIHATLASQSRAGGAVLSVAIDAQGERARTYFDQARATFPTLIDRAGMLSRLLGFKVVPNGLPLYESGVVRFAKFGGLTR